MELLGLKEQHHEPCFTAIESSKYNCAKNSMTVLNLYFLHSLSSTLIKAPNLNATAGRAHS